MQFTRQYLAWQIFRRVVNQLLHKILPLKTPLHGFIYLFFSQSGEIKTVNEINECIETLNTSRMQKAEPRLQRHILFAAPPQQHYLHADRWRKRRQRSGISYTKTSLLLGHMWSGRNSLRCVTQLCWGYTLPCCKSCPAR